MKITKCFEEKTLEIQKIPSKLHADYALKCFPNRRNDEIDNINEYMVIKSGIMPDDLYYQVTVMTKVFWPCYTVLFFDGRDGNEIFAAASVESWNKLLPTQDKLSPMDFIDWLMIQELMNNGLVKGVPKMELDLTVHDKVIYHTEVLQKGFDFNKFRSEGTSDPVSLKVVNESAEAFLKRIGEENVRKLKKYWKNHDHQAAANILSQYLCSGTEGQKIRYFSPLI